jgi:hypothetical protein
VIEERISRIKPNFMEEQRRQHSLAFPGVRRAMVKNEM